MNLVVFLIIRALDVYLWLVIASVMVSWLAVFGVINMNNKWVRIAYGYLNMVVDPPMNYIRRYIHPAGGLDFTPMIVIFIIYFIQNLLFSMLVW